MRSWRVYNDTIKVNTEWDIAGTRIGIPIFLAIAGSGVVTFILIMTLSSISGFFIIPVALAEVTFLGWIIVKTTEMSSLSKLPTLSQWQMLRGTAREPIVSNFSDILDEPEDDWIK